VITLRPYQESDALAVGRLIAATYRDFNLTFAPPAQQQAFLGPFAQAGSDDPAHQAKIAEVIRATWVFVAERDGEIVGVLRGKPEKLQSLFVRDDCHRLGIGRRLVEQFEDGCRQSGARVVKLMATLYAVPFYQAVGYKKTTGVRSMRTFEGEGLPYQPMKKVLRA
jgi:putative acetyltransferase